MQTYLFSLGLCVLSCKIPRVCLIVLFLAVSQPDANAQDTNRVRKAIRDLSAPNMHGRGYLFKGHTKAAHYIRKEFKKAGLKPLNKSYFQTFPISQNLFRKEPRLWLNGRPLKAGVDFLPSADAVPYTNTCMLIRTDSGAKKAVEKTNPLPTAFILGPKEKPPGNIPLPGQVFLRLQDKLTHTLSENQHLPLLIELRKSCLKETDSVIRLDLKPEVHPSIQARNVIGMVEGTLQKDSFLVICAHYDHLGVLGKNVFFPGANDNASGTAMLMEMAREIAARPLKYSVLFIAFSGEEAGLLGSFYFTSHPWVPLKQIRFVMNLDLMGFGENGATVVNGSVHPDLFEKLSSINQTHNYLPQLKVRGKAANSDHYPFSERGVPAFFMYSLGGPGYYHDVDDKAETLTLSGFRGMYNLILDFLKSF